ncbi:hypothetical protein C8J56DRAFT_477941 [Mycena floridula]|nr:hypothetical protein C8J56DRAFT_477941 [Mycena floridula]
MPPFLRTKYSNKTFIFSVFLCAGLTVTGSAARLVYLEHFLVRANLIALELASRSGVFNSQADSIQHKTGCHPVNRSSERRKVKLSFSFLFSSILYWLSSDILSANCSPKLAASLALVHFGQH